MYLKSYKFISRRSKAGNKRCNLYEALLDCTFATKINNSPSIQGVILERTFSIKSSKVTCNNGFTQITSARLSTMFARICILSQGNYTNLIELRLLLWSTILMNIKIPSICMSKYVLKQWPPPGHYCNQERLRGPYKKTNNAPTKRWIRHGPLMTPLSILCDWSLHILYICCCEFRIPN
jgi:hypothetical protein